MGLGHWTINQEEVLKVQVSHIQKGWRAWKSGSASFLQLLLPKKRAETVFPHGSKNSGHVTISNRNGMPIPEAKRTPLGLIATEVYAAKRGWGPPPWRVIRFSVVQPVLHSFWFNGMEDMVSVPVLCWEFLLPMIRLQTNVEVACEHSVSLLTL